MNVLIVLGNISPSDDANTNIANLIAKEVKERGHSVSMLGTAFQKCEKREIKNGIEYNRILRLKSEREKAISARWNAINEKKEKLAFCFKHPLYFCKLIARYLRNRISNPVEDKYTSALKKIVKNQKIDRAIVITSPFYVAKAAMRALKDVDLIWYQLDPNQSNTTAAYKNRKNLLEEEIELYKRVKFAVIPKLVYEENAKGELSEYLPKMKMANFPNLRSVTETETEDDVLFEKDKINVVFVGVFYEDIRSPEHFFNIAQGVKDGRFVFHVIGGGCVELLKEYSKVLGDKFIYHGYRSHATSVNAMLRADVLVNVDNLAKNMLPSKLNDYLSSCRPMLNLHPYSDSESVSYLSKYPLCLNVYTGEGMNEAQVAEIEQFCLASAGKKESFASVSEHYRASTPQYVTDLLLMEV